MLRMPGYVAAVLIVVCATSIVSGATSRAEVGEMTGRVMIQPEGDPAILLTPESRPGVGDLLTLTADSRVEITFDNGALLSLVGPAEVRLIDLDDEAIKVMLISGLINVARAGPHSLTVLTEYEVRLEMVNSSGYAEVRPGDKMRFANRKGESVVLVLLDEERVLNAGDLPFLIDLKKLDLVRKHVEPVKDDSGQIHGTGEFLPRKDQYRLDRRVIRVYPGDRVSAEVMSDGGLRLKGDGLGENEFARVEVGYEAVLYITNGEVVVLDRHGNVDEFTGRTFIERPLDPRSFRWEPVKDAADSSTIRTRTR